MNADGIAASYRWLEYAAFGRELERARFDFLDRACDARRVLILGEGDGRFLARLLESKRGARVDVVESSGRMIELARGRVPESARERVTFHRMNAAADMLPDGPFDLVVTHFFLDTLIACEAETLVSKVGALLSPGGAWLVSEFQVPDAGWAQRTHARLWLAAMYGFFSIATGLQAARVPDYGRMLARSGLVETEHRERRWGLIRSQVWRKGVG
jgi:ubiquinone/menaquinone biosynthesis C-methylase UbiE